MTDLKSMEIEELLEKLETLCFVSSLKQFPNIEGYAHLHGELLSRFSALQAWKESAIYVMPPLQEIGRELGLPLGESIHDKILPGIVSLKAENEKLRARVKMMGHTKDCDSRKTRLVRVNWATTDANEENLGFPCNCGYEELVK